MNAEIHKITEFLNFHQAQWNLPSECGNIKKKQTCYKLEDKTVLLSSVIYMEIQKCEGRSIPQNIWVKMKQRKTEVIFLQWYVGD